MFPEEKENVERKKITWNCERNQKVIRWVSKFLDKYNREADKDVSNDRDDNHEG